MADKVPSFFSRFTMKLIEIIGAGIATAVGGYLVAHLGAYWSSSAPVTPPPAAPAAPATVQIAPNATVAAKAPRLQPAPAQPVAAEAVPAPAHTLVPGEAKAGGSREATSSLKATRTETGAAATKPHEADGKPRDMESVEAEVRAALAKVDAGRPAPAEAPYQPAMTPVPTPPPPLAPPVVVAVPAKPAEAAVGTVAVAPPAEPPPPAPLDTVEIKSQPVTTPVEAVPPAATASAAPESAQADAREDGGLFAAIRKIPDMLRHGAGATTSVPPRPPMPVGD